MFNLSEQIAKMQVDLTQIKTLMSDNMYDMKKVATTTLNDRMMIVTQSEQMFGLYTAMCIETMDVWKQNRVRFFCPLFHSTKIPMKSLPWAWPISSMGGFDDCGLSWVPPAGSTLCIIFEGGARSSPYYLGTTWQRNRGPQGKNIWGIDIDEYQKVWAGHRKGYLCGPDDESQCLPQWNTETSNGYDLNSISDFDDHPEAQKRLTYPHIYGFKTPEKHMLKLHDGDPKCNRRWKRIELLSSCGNWLIFKDDHLHYAGQWASKDCGGGVRPGGTNCIAGAGEGTDIAKTQGVGGFLPDLKDPTIPTPDLGDIGAAITLNNAEETDDTPKEGEKLEKPECGNVIGGHSDTPLFKQWKPTKYQQQQTGDNPFFKHKNECRPYKGPGTNRQTKAELPQSGIQMMSISGHTWIMDDSVEEPTGDCAWERVLRPFDYGCNNLYVGHMTLRSHAGHQIILSDIEEDEPMKRGEDNFIRIQSQAGNIIELNDMEKQIGIAGFRRGISMRTTSTHMFVMIDEDNEQSLMPRQEGNEPVPKAKKAYIKLKSGYGLEFKMEDENSQEKTVSQRIQIFCPQRDNRERGPHIMRFQERPSGPGQILLRAGGDYITMTYDDHIEIVGDKEKNPSNKITIVSKNKIVDTEKVYINLADLHIFLAKKQILLLAGQDCPPVAGSGDPCGPCPAQVVVYQNGKLKISDRVIASCSFKAPCASIFMLSPFVKKCEDDGGCSGGKPPAK